MSFSSSRKALANTLPDETSPDAKATFVKTCPMIMGDMVARICLVDSSDPTVAVSVTVTLWGYSAKIDTWVHIEDVVINAPRGGSEDITNKISPYDRIHVQGNRPSTDWFLAMAANQLGR